jgi:hypothetical protein
VNKLSEDQSKILVARDCLDKATKIRNISNWGETS